MGSFELFVLSLHSLKTKHWPTLSFFLSLDLFLFSVFSIRTLSSVTAFVCCVEIFSLLTRMEMVVLLLLPRQHWPLPLFFQLKKKVNSLVFWYLPWYELNFLSFLFVHSIVKIIFFSFQILLTSCRNTRVQCFCY